MKTQKIPIVGMHCASCKALIERVVSRADGVESVSVNYGTEQMRVTYNEDVIDRTALDNAVQSLGDYRLVLDETNSHGRRTKEKERYLANLKKRFLFVMIASTPFMFLMVHMMSFFVTGQGLFPMALTEHALTVGDYSIHTFVLAQLLLSGMILFYGGAGFYYSAWSAVKKWSANMDTLVVLGTTSAWVYSSVVTLFPFLFAHSGTENEVFFEAAVFIILFILTGRYFEEHARQATRQGVQKLVELQAVEANLMRDGVEVKVPLSAVKIDDELVVKPGGKVPVDGVLLEGHAVIDESMISGEPMPVEKKNGASVVGATILQLGSFHMRATSVGSDTVLAQIITMVEEAQGSEAPIQRIADRVAGIFVPIVIVIAIFTFCFWYFAGMSLNLLTEDVSVFSFAIYAMISVLIIACPCALGLATPTAIIVGMGAAATKGILIKDAGAIERAYKIGAILLDKTGTVTEGSPVVQDVMYFGEELVADRLAYTLEKKSEHPLASAITNYTQQYEGTHVHIKNFLNIDGVGVQAHVDDQLVIIAKASALDAYSDVSDDVRGGIAVFEEKGYTIAGLIVEGSVKALYGVADKVKTTSKDAVAMLHAQSIGVTMLTGDHQKSAERVAFAVGIDDVVANVMPADKERLVREKKESLPTHQLVAMVGDGINDAPALARADVGIAMGTGTDIAIESGDIIIVKGSLTKVAEAIAISSRTMRTIKQNLFWAFGYNIIAIPIAAGVLYPLFGMMLSPIIASAAMAFSSVSVVLNSLRLRSLQHR